MNAQNPSHLLLANPCRKGTSYIRGSTWVVIAIADTQSLCGDMECVLTADPRTLADKNILIYSSVLNICNTTWSMNYHVRHVSSEIPTGWIVSLAFSNDMTCYVFNTHFGLFKSFQTLTSPRAVSVQFKEKYNLRLDIGGANNPLGKLVDVSIRPVTTRPDSTTHKKEEGLPKPHGQPSTEEDFDSQQVN